MKHTCKVLLALTLSIIMSMPVYAMDLGVTNNGASTNVTTESESTPLPTIQPDVLQSATPAPTNSPSPSVTPSASPDIDIPIVPEPTNTDRPDSSPTPLPQDSALQSTPEPDAGVDKDLSDNTESEKEEEIIITQPSNDQTAANTEQAYDIEEVTSYKDYDINPYYKELLDQNQFESSENKTTVNRLSQTYSDSNTFYIIDDAISYIKYQTRCRQTNLSFTLYDTRKSWKTTFQDAMHGAMEELPGCAPDEGDYLMFSYYYSNATGYSYYDKYTYNISVVYWSTAAQEEQVNLKINSILNELNIWNGSEYEKIKAVYDYIIKHVTYDDTLQKHSAYNALVENNAVCQGYVLAVHRLLKHLGVSTRIIPGDAGGAHAWNIAAVNGLYYNLDATWDECVNLPYYSYEYFLKNMADFPGHSRDYDYSTSEFMNKYPMATLSYGSPGYEYGKPKVSVTFDYLDNLINVKITGLSSSVSAVTVPVWSEVKGQDDLTYLYASKWYDDSWRVSIDLRDHNYDSGIYNIHVYARYGTAYEGIYYTTTTVDDWNNGNISILNKNETAGLFNVIIKNLAAPGGIKQVRVAVWSNINGQDDLKWYTAYKSGSTYNAYIDIANHNFDSGIYNIHVYYQNIGGYEKIAGTTTTVMKPTSENSVLTLNKDLSQGTITAILQNPRLSSSDSGILFAVWNTSNGQDDLKWYNADKADNSMYYTYISVLDHKDGIGTSYNVHAYTKLANGSPGRFITGSIINIEGITGGKITSSVDSKAGKFSFNVTELKSPAMMSSITAAVWSKSNGQDDLKWYNSKYDLGKASVTVDTGNHNYDTGIYYVHVYAKDSRGIQQLVKTTTIDMSIDNSNIAIQLSKSEDEGQISATLSNAKIGNGLNGVLFAVWSSANGQDDLKWYPASKINNSTYKLNINIGDHKYDTGQYNIHAYSRSSAGMPYSCLKTGKISVASIDGGKVSITNKDNNTGSFIARISGISSPAVISNVQVAVWSDINGQDDLKWYSALKTGDEYLAYIYTSNHSYDNGAYQIHAYATDKRGVKKLVGVTSTVMNINFTNISMEVLQNPTNSDLVTVTLYNTKLKRGSSGVMFAVWSDANGQDDLYWYKATQLNMTTYQITFSLKQYHNSTRGLYNFHAYTQNSSGAVGSCLKTSTEKVK